MERDRSDSCDETRNARNAIEVRRRYSIAIGSLSLGIEYEAMFR
jgi:hypothetical protein